MVLIDNDNLLYNDIKELKAIGDLQSSGNINDLNSAISNIQMDTNKLKSKNKSLKDQLEELKRNELTLKLEITSIQDSYNNLKHQNLEFIKQNDRLKAKLEEGAIYNRVGQKINNQPDRIKEEFDMLKADKEKLITKNKNLALDLKQLKDQFTQLKEDRQNKTTSHVVENPDAELLRADPNDDLTTSLQKSLTSTLEENNTLTQKVKELEYKLLGASRMANNFDE